MSRDAAGALLVEAAPQLKPRHSIMSGGQPLLQMIWGTAHYRIFPPPWATSVK